MKIKFTRVLIVLAAATLAVGCNKADNDGPEDEKRIPDSNPEGGSYTIDKANSLFLIDNADKGKFTWADAQTKCETPYRMPNKNEVTILSVYNKAFTNAQWAGDYWSSSDWGSEQFNWGITISSGYIYNAHYFIDDLYVRCIQENSAISSVVYPYVDSSSATEGPIIVSRAAAGGVPSFALADDDDDRVVAEKFRVANTDTGANYGRNDRNVCTDGWRLPTIPELQLIWLMGGAEEAQYNAVAGSHFAQSTPLYSLPSFTALQAIQYWNVSDTPICQTNMKNGDSASMPNARVRCVKTVN